ncbi:acyl-CoA dehydrogenase family protein [Arenicella xantha]|uniref:Acyl-CoA dehydrogenase n=1 Tax=Arenicella xantha TaxID=644221 RepID=A0A395JVG4_9GAMM|nr:acyl-CoA dehydrogenase family protein [Arenicella xantha]RBP53558.1 acyl-CoA dehydrogenase [Arenicella xantha]
MSDKSFLDWPFFDAKHKTLALDLEKWCDANLDDEHPHDIDQACRDLVEKLAAGGWLTYAAPVANQYGEVKLDVRSLCIIRETLARYSGLADFSFAMQGLGSGSISLFGTPAIKDHYLPRVRNGQNIAAFALSELEAGSDVAAMQTSAVLDGDEYIINGSKTWISNGGIADHYVVFARTGEMPGSKGLSAFVVDADTAGLSIEERIEVIAPHPLATLKFTDMRVPKQNLLGNPGEGFRVAMATLDIFRSTVGAASMGFARRALDESLHRANTRELFGAPLFDLQATQTKIADMAVDIDASALLIYRAAWTKDCVKDRVTREAAMAKLYATESAQKSIDQAVQLFGGMGVKKGCIVESLYREVRALRIYEGASEVQKTIIANQTNQLFKAQSI